MLYPDGVIEDIRSQNDIIAVISSYTALTQKGSNYMGLCPFHREKTPSFSVSADKQLFFCFGCGATGNVITFVMQKENYDFVEAIKFLADRIRYTLPEPSQNAEFKKLSDIKNSLYEIHAKAARYYYDILKSEKGAKASAYLDARGVSEKTRIYFGLGYSGYERGGLYKHLLALGYSDELISKSGLVIADKKGGYFDRFSGRLMFPIFDVYGKTVGFGGRILDSGEPKYLNSPETLIFSKSKNLYGINYARKSKAKSFILVEGYMDVIALHQNGFLNSVASLGTAFNEEHASVLRKHTENVALLFDNDSAGEKAALRAYPVLSRAGLNVRILQLDSAKDPDEYLKKNGRDSFAELIGSAESATSFHLKVLKKNYNLKDPIEKTKYIEDAGRLLSELKSPVEREVYSRELAEIAGVSESTVIGEVEKAADKKADLIMNFSYKNKSMVSSNGRFEKQRDEARRGLLAAIALDRERAAELLEQVSAEEFAVPEYIELYMLIEKAVRKNEPVVSAELISRFPSLEAQKTVSGVFSQKQEFESPAAYLTALNQQITLVKIEYVNHSIENLPGNEEIAAMNAEQRKECDEKSFLLYEKLKKLRNLVSNGHKWIK